jgi:protein phosphatase PTC7
MILLPTTFLYRERLEEKRLLKMVAGAFYIPKGTSGLKGKGDDALFICEEKQTIGVADGMGGWAAMGAYPGEYAPQLMANCLEAILVEPEGEVDLRRVLNQAFSNTKVKGASTACIMNLIDHVCSFFFFFKYTAVSLIQSVYSIGICS